MDKTYRLNTRLIKNLSSAVFMPAAEIVDATGMNRSTWYRIVESPHILTVQQLIVIADGLHIPVRRFFSEGRTDVIGRREDYIAEDYRPCSYDADTLQDIIDSRPDLSWQMAAEATRVTRDNLRLSLLAVTHTPVVRFLKACEAWKLDPFRILVDPNPEPKTEKRKGQKTEKADLRAEIGRLRDDVQALSGTVEDLVRKYEALLDAHKSLAQRVSVNIGNVSRSYIGITADPLSTKDPDK